MILRLCECPTQSSTYDNFIMLLYLFCWFLSRVLQNLSQINIVNSQNSLSDLMATAHIQQAATWQLYGKE